MAEESSDRWWKTCLWGVLCFGICAFTYHQIYEFENATQGSIRLWKPIMWLYDLGGIWLASGLWLVLGLVLLIGGFVEKAKASKRSDDSPTEDA